MIILELRKHFPPRAIEWLISGILMSWGITVILTPGLFRLNEAFTGLLAMAPQERWGLYAMAIGAIRMGALFINGSWRRTPIIRVLCSFASAFVWTQVFLGFLNSPIPTTAFAFFPWFIASDLYSAFRAATDAYIAQRAMETSRTS
jgi:hypothetical protein